MAKGKHAARALHRRNEQEHLRLIALAQRWEAAFVACDRAEQAADAFDRDTEALDALHESLNRNRAGDVAAAAAVLDQLEEAVENEERLAAEVRAAFNDAVLDLCDAIFGDSDAGAVEQLIAVANPVQDAHVRDGVDNAQLPMRIVKRLQKTRGRRRTTPTAAFTPVAERHHPNDFGLPHQRPNIAWVQSSYVYPFADAATHDLLGIAVGSDDSDGWVRDAQPLDDAASQAARSQRPKGYMRGRWANPFQTMPLFPHPADAHALHGWYLSAATNAPGFWSAVDDRPDFDALWHSTERLLASATPHWLPTGQSAAYATSEPLSTDEWADVRLPYASTMVLLAEPLWLPPTATEPPPEALRRDLHDLGELAATKAARRLTRPDSTNIGGYVWFSEAIAHLGANIEGVCFEADPEGKPTGRIVTCVAIPNPQRSAILTRWPVPSWLDKTVAANEFRQLAAAAAWATWVHCDTHGGLDQDDTPPQERPANNAVRVLDVVSTEHDPAEHPDTGRSVATHLRRGHWRRQHHGPGNTLLKRIRIAPVVVNPSAGGLVPRIHRIRP